MIKASNQIWHKWCMCSDIDPSIFPSEVINRVRMKGIALLFLHRIIRRPIQIHRPVRTVTRYTNRRGVEIVASKHHHPAGAYGYRITEAGKTMVYCTDVEYEDEIDPDVVALSRNADLLIHDAQYTPSELSEKRGWGHSSWEQAVEVAEQAGVKGLALFHHDPEHNDAFLLNVEKECEKRFPGVFLAREGLMIEL